jgi:cation:H+ antiporter
VALGVGAIIQPLPFGKKVMRYALFGFPIGVMAVGFIWDGQVNRLEGLILLALYVVYIAVIWIVEKQPPAMGETGVLEEAELTEHKGRVGKELLLVGAGLLAMTIGSTMLVEAVRQITNIEETQTMLALTLVGFATASLLHKPAIAMLLSLLLVILLATWNKKISQGAGWFLVASYPVFLLGIF